MQLPEQVNFDNASKLPVLNFQEGINPQQLLIQQLHREELETREQNVLIANFNKILAKSEEQRIDIMRAINPLDEAENWLGKEIEYLHMVKEILRSYLKVDGTISNLEEIQAIYNKRLGELRQDFIEGYKERLKSRPFIFRENKFIPLTKETIALYLDEFIVKLDQYLEEFAKKFFLCYISDDTLLINYDLRLSEEIEAKKHRLHQLLETKTPLGERYLDIDGDLAKSEQKFKQQLISVYDSNDNSLPSLCFQRRIEAVVRLLEQNPKLINQPNSLGELAIHRACEANSFELTVLLLSKGAKPEILDETRNQLSAFHYAAMYGNVKLLTVLLSKGGQKSNIDEKLLQIKGQKNRTLLHSAAFANNLAVLEWLCERKLIDINGCDSLTGATALHVAAWLGYPRIIEKLLVHGANPNCKNKEGDRPIFVAALYRQPAVLLAFLKQGLWLTDFEIKQLLNFVKTTDGRRSEQNRLFMLCLDVAIQNYRDSIQTYTQSKSLQVIPAWLRSPVHTVLPEGKRVNEQTSENAILNKTQLISNP